MALEPGNLPATSHSAGLRPVTPRRMFARAAQWTLAVAFIVVFAIRHRYDLTGVDWGQFHFGYFVSSVCLALFSQAAVGVRWYCLVPASIRPFTVGDACRTVFLSALSNYTPAGTYGGMALRVLCLVRRRPSEKGAAALSVFVDRLVGCSTLFLIGFLSSFFLTVPLEAEAGMLVWTFRVVGGALLAIGLACLLVVVLVRQERSGKFLRCQMVFSALVMLRSGSARLPRACFWSLVAQLASGLSLACTAYAWRQDRTIPTVVEHVFLLPVVEIAVTIVPTPAGIGVREYGLATLYRVICAREPGAASKLGFLVAMTSRFVTLIAIVIGIGLCLGRRSEPASFDS